MGGKRNEVGRQKGRGEGDREGEEGEWDVPSKLRHFVTWFQTGVVR